MGTVEATIEIRDGDKIYTVEVEDVNYQLNMHRRSDTPIPYIKKLPLLAVDLTLSGIQKDGDATSLNPKPTQKQVKE